MNTAQLMKKKALDALGRKRAEADKKAQARLVDALHTIERAADDGKMKVRILFSDGMRRSVGDREFEPWLLTVVQTLRVQGFAAEAEYDDQENVAVICVSFEQAILVEAKEET